MNQIEFREEMAAMPKIVIQNKWDDHRMSLRKHAKNEPVEEFTRWSTVRATMFIGNAPYIDNEYEELRQDDAWKGIWQKAIVDPGVGAPIKFPHRGRFRTSGNYIHTAYLLLQWRKLIIESPVSFVNSNRVFEFGGGYGAMTHILNGLISNITGYTLFDLPEFSLLQRYYLENVMEDTHSVHFETALPKKTTKYDMFISTAAMSEVDFALRDRVFKFVYADHYLITFQPVYFERDNMGYFEEFVRGKGRDPKKHIHPISFTGHWMLAI